jgi:hypothetical protein
MCDHLAVRLTWWQWVLLVVLFGSIAEVVPVVGERFGAWAGERRDGYAAAFMLGVLYVYLCSLIVRPRGAARRKTPDQGHAEAPELRQ